jgi:hypothetical protein
MADVLRMPALELRNPVALVILVKADDTSFHANPDYPRSLKHRCSSPHNENVVPDAMQGIGELSP